MRRFAISSALNHFVSAHDIICIQETHLAPEEAQALSSLPGCTVTRNGLQMGRGGTAIIDTPSLREHYRGREVALPPPAAGHVQLRIYTPLDSSRKPFQLFNAYFKSGGDFAFNSALLQAMGTADPGIATFLCGDLNFIEDASDSTTANPLLPPSQFTELWNTFKSKYHLHDPPHNAHT